jgi:hypothetical protein
MYMYVYIYMYLYSYGYTYTYTFMYDSIYTCIYTLINSHIHTQACTAICMWARAMYKFHFVNQSVAPKRAKLLAAEEELKEVMAQLAVAMKTLQDVNER